MIGSLVPETDEKWYAFLEFLQILEKAVRAKIWKNTVESFRKLIHLFFVEYLKQFPDENLKPKAHFLQHYPQMIGRFGPIVKTLSLKPNTATLKQQSSVAKIEKMFVLH